MDFFVSVIAPLVGALSCIRIFPLSLRKFSTIVLLWLFLMICSLIMKFIPVFFPAQFQYLLTFYSAETISAGLGIVGVFAGMVLLPLTYFAVFLFRKQS